MDDKAKKILFELNKSYLLSGRTDLAKNENDLKASAIAIALEDNSDNYPIPLKWIELVFRYARKKYSFPAYTDIRKVWESQEIHDEIREIRKKEQKYLPPAKEESDISPEELEKILETSFRAKRIAK